ncbi:MAG: BspA family leucine-rich repeat surface protein [Mycoplasmatota bacterium]
MKDNKKGFTIIELICSFVIISVIIVFLFQILLHLKDIYVEVNLVSEIATKESLIESYISADFMAKELINIEQCGDNCFNFTYADASTGTLFLNDNNTVLTYNDYSISLSGGTTFGRILFSDNVLDEGYEGKQSLLKLTIPIYNNILDESNYIEVYNRYDYSKLDKSIYFNLVDGATFNSKVKSLSSYNNVTTINFDDNIPENINSYSETIDLSVEQDQTIIGYVDGTTLNIVAEGNFLANADCSEMFYQFTNIEEIDFNSETTGKYIFITTKVTNMYRMFRETISLTTLNLSGFDTSNVTNMSVMFYSNTALTSLNLTNFNTANVTNMSWMFGYCSGITELDLSNFNTTNVTNMSSMFYGNSSLTKLNVGSFDTANVTNMSSMFYNNSSLIELGLMDFDTTKITTMRQMFYNVSSLTILDLANFDTPNLTDIYMAFSYMDSLIYIDISNLDTDKVTDFSGLFRTTWNNDSLEYLDISSFNSGNATNMSWMFYGRMHLSTLIFDTETFTTSKVTLMGSMFRSCEALTSLDLSNFDTANVTDFSSMLDGFQNLTSLTLSDKFVVQDGANLSSMFWNLQYSGNLDISSFNINSTHNIESMFTNANIGSVSVASSTIGNLLKSDGSLSSSTTITVK